MAFTRRGLFTESFGLEGRSQPHSRQQGLGAAAELVNSLTAETQAGVASEEGLAL